jgi:hypothetical protein
MLANSPPFALSQIQTFGGVYAASSAMILSPLLLGNVLPESAHRAINDILVGQQKKFLVRSSFKHSLCASSASHSNTPSIYPSAKYRAA